MMLHILCVCVMKGSVKLNVVNSKCKSSNESTSVQADRLRLSTYFYILL